MNTPLPLWKINLAAFVLLLGLAAGGMWFQLDYHQRIFRQEVMEHASLVAGIIKFNTEHVIIAEKIVKQVFRQFMGNMARFTAYLNMVEPFHASELEAFARESGLAGTCIVNNKSGRLVCGPPELPERLNIKLECRNRSNQLVMVPSANLMIFIPPVQGEECVMVAVDSDRLNQLKRHAGMKKALEEVSRLKGIKSVRLLNADNKKQQSEGIIFQGETVSVELNTNAGRLIVDMDAEHFYRIRRRTMLNFISLAAGLLITGGMLTFIVYRYQQNYIIRLRKIEKEMALEKENAALGRSAATIAHEIRNPLNSVSMGLQNIQMDTLPADAQQGLVSIMLEEIKRANAIVSQMLRFSSFSTPELELLSMKDIIAEQILLLESQFEGQGIRVSATMEDVNIMADRNMILQMISNLLVNAVNAQPDGGYVKIFLARSGEMVQLVISNNGTMPHIKDIEQLFEPYVTTGTRGTGLGLAICKRIINLHKGSIKAAIENDSLFKITVILPLDMKKQ